MPQKVLNSCRFIRCIVESPLNVRFRLHEWSVAVVNTVFLAVRCNTTAEIGELNSFYFFLVVLPAAAWRTPSRVLVVRVIHRNDNFVTLHNSFGGKVAESATRCRSQVRVLSGIHFHMLRGTKRRAGPPGFGCVITVNCFYVQVFFSSSSRRRAERSHA